ncbi:hypothetical protein CDD83_6507 [Cordyceps sp. RAO-2017]|nr:hypothetical protein CDD83_6507 [Cordyceps sp. RAO-2017]
MARLEGKVAIVTGGASGFGRGIAAKFAREGCRVVVADVNAEAGAAAAAELGGTFVRADVCRRDDWERLLAETLAAHGQLDIVVNNAGTTYAKKATVEVTEAEFDLVWGVNVKSVYWSATVLVPYFVREKRPGCFIQVASTAGIRPRAQLTWYNATKGAVITATKSMAVEYAPHRIRFNAVSPVLGMTAITHLFLGSEASTESLTPYLATVPLGRPSEPEDVANACCYLASDEASFITGVSLEVDGGRCV